MAPLAAGASQLAVLVAVAGLLAGGGGVAPAAAAQEGSCPSTACGQPPPPASAPPPGAAEAWSRSGDDNPARGPVAAALLVGAVLQLALAGGLLAHGRVAARLAAWGLVSEAWGARSVSSVCALLRLKAKPTPSIELRGCVTDELAAVLGGALRAHGRTAQTRAVALPGNPQLSAHGVAALCRAALVPSSPLRALDLSHNPQLGDAAAAVLAPSLAGDASAPPLLRVLRLAECGITARGVESLGRALGASVLRTLDLSLNALRGSGAALAEVVSEAALLEELRLVDAGLLDTDVEPLAAALPGSELTCLDLAFNAIAADGVAALAGRVGSTQLRRLSLVCNRITAGEALGRLAGAWASRDLGGLELGGNELTDEELRAFQEILASLAA